jgi:hypothetical protein
LLADYSMRVRLRKKFAERVNGVDLTGRRVGDVFELPDADAERLIEVGWATAKIEQRHGSGHRFSGVERRKPPHS